ncbi:hypothetical protein MT899_001821 [Salmonella enterica subsp. enterica]|nr:hypothetical protein [Salmonella enterica subsp. enterica]EJB3513233.1 hypothetical protein [Salmonella enterica subsp. enterica]
MIALAGCLGRGFGDDSQAAQALYQSGQPEKKLQTAKISFFLFIASTASPYEIFV